MVDLQKKCNCKSLWINITAQNKNHNVRNCIVFSYETDIVLHRIISKQIQQLVSYLRSLTPPPSVASARGIPVEQERFQRGQALFEKKQCTQCHHTGVYTSRASYDVGIHDDQGNRRFNPPSLRGVSQRYRLFHDNRFESLEQVLGKFQHQLAQPLTKKELSDLIYFLNRI